MRDENYRPRGAHPRSRGEHEMNFAFWSPKLGSSPLARGAPVLELEDPRGAGLIPARAGSTLPVLRSGG